MANGIDKKALFKLKSEPYLKPISDLGVGFYNLDENTAILRFQLSNEKGPLLVHENNLTAYAYFESSNGSVSDVIELEIEDSFNGIVTITLDKEFLQASTSTKVKGQVYIGVNNVDGNPEYNEVAVFREFTFEVADALINKISAFTKIEYIRMFDQLKMRIEQKVRDIEEAIANGADYVTEMKSVLQEGIETLNAIVTEGKSDIQQYITQAKTDLTKVKDDATEDITTTANNAKTSVQDTASTAVNSINSKTTEATDHVDAKVTEFNQTVDNNGFLTPDKLTEDLATLNWQKKKLTNEDGGYETISLDSDVDKLHSTEGGLYYFTSVPITDASSTAGYAQVETRTGVSNIKIITFKPYNSNQIWVKRLYNTWNDWERIDTPQTDTGWVPFQLINGAVANTAFKAETDKGFDCAYRIEKRGNVTEKSIRINASKLSHSQQIAQLPENFVKSVQFHYVRAPINQGYGLVGVFPSGAVYVYIESDKRDGWDTTSQSYYFYGEFNWKE
ncbi:hypothetical protein [Staphylococcus saprophyticus]|uniref:hypothetical protein n=1 Tax=Staphylococcus saprophyticus TaxID=29385 RepID=UPI00374F32C6